MTTSEYHKREEGNKVVFEVTPASCPRNKTMLYISAPVLFLICIGLLLNGTWGIVTIAVLVAAFWYLGVHKDWRPAAHRTASTFSVSPAGIESNGQSFKKEDIHRLHITNGMTRNELAGAVIASGRPGMGAFAISQQYRGNISKVTNSLDLETGGRAFTLAGGLSETTAFGLMTDVNRALGV